MVKVAAPALSLDASGKLGGAIVYSKWKGRPYVRELVIPANPKTVSQVGVRAMFKFLAQNWAALEDAEKADWLDRSKQLIASTFNAYMSYNQKRWRNFLCPSVLDPATEDGTLPTADASTATGGVRQITIEKAITVIEDAWGMVIHRSPTAVFTPAFSNMVAAVLADTVATIAWVDTPLEIGTYYYQVACFDKTGQKDSYDAEISAAAT